MGFGDVSRLAGLQRHQAVSGIFQKRDVNPQKSKKTQPIDPE